MNREDVPIEALELLCRAYSEANAALAETTDLIREERRAAIEKYEGSLRERLLNLRGARESLRAAIDASPDLFVKPKTLTFGDVKVGWRKQPGKIRRTKPEDKVIAEIRRKLPAHEPVLIKVKESLIAAGLRALDAKSLAGIGVRIEDVDDQMVLTSITDDLDVLVAGLLKEIDEGEETVA